MFDAIIRFWWRPYTAHGLFALSKWSLLSVSLRSVMNGRTVERYVYYIAMQTEEYAGGRNAVQHVWELNVKKERKKNSENLEHTQHKKKG